MSSRLAAAFATVICAIVITACGSSGQPGGAAPAGGPLLAFARCIRAHGVPDFPDPSATGGLVIPNRIDPQSPAFLSARQACARLGSPPGQAGGSASESAKIRLLALATCMRAHGVPSFRDPTRSPPPPSSGNAMGGGGWYLALGTLQEQRSPAYRKAASACGARAP